MSDQHGYSLAMQLEPLSEIRKLRQDRTDLSVLAKQRIVIPHVTASVSAAGMNGISCIAMELLERKTLDHVARWGEMRCDNEFICHETWIQLQSILTAQIDKHVGNALFTQYDPVIIDHDLSFPTNPLRSIVW
jgi:hypothetical protein